MYHFLTLLNFFLICTDPPPCDTSGLEGALKDQLAEIDAIYKDADYDENTINEDVDFEAKGLPQGMKKVPLYMITVG